jgi:hypothetical protein
VTVPQQEGHCKDPGAESASSRVWGEGHWNLWEDQPGFPDQDDEESWKEDPAGIGGNITWLLREGQYIFGWDRWADKRGSVHST